MIAVASRCGLQSHDFSIAWDGGSFEPSRPEHELTTTRKDGSRAAAGIGDDVLLCKDAWKYFRYLENAFAQLNRRLLPREEQSTIAIRGLRELRGSSRHGSD